VQQTALRLFFAKVPLFAVLRSAFAIQALLTFDQDLGSRTPRFILSPLPTSDAVFHFVGYAYYAAVFLFVLGFRVQYTGLIAGAMKILVILMDFEERRAFFYLPPLGLIAFALASRRNSDEEENHNAISLVLLICSIYLFASFHKAYNFSLMQANLPADASTWFHTGMGKICSSFPCERFWRFVTWTVVPVEGTIGILFSFAQTRRFAFLLAILFHLILLTVFDLYEVAIPMLIMEAALATLQARLNWKDLLSKRRLTTLIVPLMVWSLLAAESWMTQMNLLFYFFKALAVIWPMIWLGCIGFFASESRKVRWKTESFAYACFLFLFGISPTLFHYTLPGIGWTMFAGPMVRQTPNNYVLEFDSPHCPLKSRYELVAYQSTNQDGEMIYVSTRKEFLEQLANFAKQVCPEIKVRLAR
jgi:hypothetical protein